MIHEIVEAIEKELNLYLRIKFAIKESEDKVIVANIMEQDGSVAIKEEDKIVLSVVNIAKDGHRGGSPAKIRGTNAPVNISIYLLFAAYFKPDNYKEALRYISAVIGYFQKKGTIHPNETPSLPDYVGSLAVELLEPSFDELSNMWNAIGAKYVPSVLYRIRSISITDERIRKTSPITGIEV